MFMPAGAAAESSVVALLIHGVVYENEGELTIYLSAVGRYAFMQTL